MNPKQRLHAACHMPRHHVMNQIQIQYPIRQSNPVVRSKSLLSLLCIHDNTGTIYDTDFTLLFSESYFLIFIILTTTCKYVHTYMDGWHDMTCTRVHVMCNVYAYCTSLRIDILHTHTHTPSLQDARSVARVTLTNNGRLCAHCG